MAQSALDEVSDSGAFARTASSFRNFISRDPNTKFPVESERYHLYISYACPWASRCLAYLKIKGLDKAISFTVCFVLFFINVPLVMFILVRAKSNNLVNVKLLFSQSNPYGKEPNKVTSTWDGFFLFPTLRNQGLNLTL